MIELIGDPIGIVIGSISGLTAFVSGFIWLVRRQDRLYAQSEKLHNQWLVEELEIRKRQKSEYETEQARLRLEITELRLMVTDLRERLHECQVECREARLKEVDLIYRIEMLEREKDV